MPFPFVRLGPPGGPADSRLTSVQEGVLERIFWATLGHVEDELGGPYEGTDYAVKRAFDSMKEDAARIADELRADPEAVRAFLAEVAEPYADVNRRRVPRGGRPPMSFGVLYCRRCGEALEPDGDKWVHTTEDLGEGRGSSHFPDAAPLVRVYVVRGLPRPRSRPSLCPNCDRPRLRGAPCVCGYGGVR